MLERIVAGNRTGAGYSQSPYNVLDGTHFIFNIVLSSLFMQIAFIQQSRAPCGLKQLNL